MNLLTDKIIDKSFIQNLIPQKTPFVMVDKLLFFSNEKVVSGFTIPQDHLFTSDNFFTAPGLIEHMAQTVALHTGYQYFLLKKPDQLPHENLLPIFRHTSQWVLLFHFAHQL